MTMKESWGNKIFLTCSIIFLTSFLVIIAYPLIFIVGSSFSSTDAVISSYVWLYPVDFLLNGYTAILEYKPIWIGYLNSVFYTFAGSIINVSLTLLAAYPLSRKDLRGRKGIMMALAFTMLFSGGGSYLRICLLMPSGW